MGQADVKHDMFIAHKGQGLGFGDDNVRQQISHTCWEVSKTQIYIHIGKNSITRCSIQLMQ